MKIKTGFWALALSALSAQAADLSFGTRNQEGQEFPRLSVRVTGTETRIRIAPLSTELKCSRHRTDLCGHASDVAMIEARTKTENCASEGTALVSCLFHTFRGSEVHAVLTDGTHLDLPSFTADLRVGILNELQWAPGPKFFHHEKTSLHFEIWGNRADGLDPLFQARQPGRFVNSVQPITKSLFD